MKTIAITIAGLFLIAGCKNIQGVHGSIAVDDAGRRIYSGGVTFRPLPARNQK